MRINNPPNIIMMRKLLALTAIALGLAGSASAQSTADEISFKPTPYMFVGLQGGAQTTFVDYDQLKLITPTASVSFGAFFVPSVGARLHVNGIWNKSGLTSNNTDFEYDYKYLTTDIDLLFNLCTLFGKKDYYPLNVYLIGGVGLNYSWDNDDLVNSPYLDARAWKDNLLSHNLRVGAMLDYNIAKHWSVNLEVSANSLSDRYNSQFNNRDDWQLTAQLGVMYKFGFKAKPAPVVVKEPEPEPVAPPVQVVEEKPEVVPVTPVVKPEPKKLEEMQKDIFFDIAKSNIRASETSKVKEVIEWMKAHPTATATITGHADAGTGNPTLNARYAEERAQTVAKAIVDGGIDSNRLTVSSKGDTVMPYGDNEKSRVAIFIGQEK